MTSLALEYTRNKKDKARDLSSEAMNEAGKLVKDLWPNIISFAQVLLEKRTIGGQEFATFIDSMGGIPMRKQCDSPDRWWELVSPETD